MSSSFLSVANSRNVSFAPPNHRRTIFDYYASQRHRNCGLMIRDVVRNVATNLEYSSRLHNRRKIFLVRWIRTSQDIIPRRGMHNYTVKPTTKGVIIYEAKAAPYARQGRFSVIYKMTKLLDVFAHWSLIAISQWLGKCFLLCTSLFLVAPYFYTKSTLVIFNYFTQPSKR